MSWRSIPLLKATTIAAAALLFAAGPAMAQHQGGGGHGGGGHGGGGHSGDHGGGFHGGGHSAFHGGGHGSFHGGGFHASSGFHGGGHSSFHGGVSHFHAGSFHGGFHDGFHHGGFNHGFRHFGYYPRFYGGFGYGYPYYGGLGYYPYDYYPYYGGDYYAPSSYDYLGLNDYDNVTPPAYSPSYFPPDGGPSAVAPADNTAHVRVIVPAGAEVWFDGTKTSQTGGTREFVSPPLLPDTNYSYEVRARWMDNGAPVDQTRRVIVRAGALTTVDFTRPEPAR
jgi:uncharacterized protein (TIGR03000 family)